MLDPLVSSAIKCVVNTQMPVSPTILPPTWIQGWGVSFLQISYSSSLDLYIDVQIDVQTDVHF